MSELLEIVVRGLGTGATYALLALGFVIIYRAMRVISFAQPALMVAGAVAVSYLTPQVGFALAVPLAVLVGAGLGLTVERTAIRPMIGKPVFVIAIITLGIDVVVRVFVNALIGTDVRQLGDPWGLDNVTILGVDVQQRYLAGFAAAAIVVAGLLAFLRWTRYGLAMRAVALDQEAAMSQGISVGKVFALSWALAGGLAAVAGVFVGTGSGVDQTTFIIAFAALPAIILGGIDSVGGAVVGGLAVGLVQSLVAGYQADVAPWLGANFQLVSPYLLMVAVLLVRPYGLFGTPEVERV
ncbi:MAG: branched-chain amino acid ABC transporter permease [Jiangellaceae bacterium]